MDISFHNTYIYQFRLFGSSMANNNHKIGINILSHNQTLDTSDQGVKR